MRVEIRRSPRRQAAAGDNETRVVLEVSKCVEALTPFLFAQLGAWKDETEFISSCVLEYGKAFASLLGHMDDDIRDSVALDETTQQLARYAARGAERFHVGAELNGDSGHVNSAPPGSRCGAAPRSFLMGATRSTEVDMSIEGLMVKVTMSAMAAFVDELVAVRRPYYRRRRREFFGHAVASVGRGAPFWTLL